jgi:cell division protease FtsH
VGPINYGSNSQDMYTQASPKLYSVNTEDLIDQEVKELINAGHELAKKILTVHIDQLHRIAKTLLEKETLTGDELKELAFGKKVSKKEIKPSDTKIEIKRSKSIKKVPTKKPIKKIKK